MRACPLRPRSARRGARRRRAGRTNRQSHGLRPQTRSHEIHGDRRHVHEAEARHGVQSHRWSQWRVPPAPGRPDNEEDDEGEQRPFRLTELVDAGADGALGVAEGQTGDKRGDEAVAPTSSAPAKATAAREKTDSRCVYPRPTPSRPARARAVDVLGQGQPMNLVQFKRHDGGGSSSRPRRDGRAGHRR